MPKIFYPCDPACPAYQALQAERSPVRGFTEEEQEELELQHRFSCQRCLRYGLAWGQAE